MAKNKTSVSDEEIIVSLLSNGTIKAAAAAVGISERSIYDRMNEGEFIALYKSAKADLIRGAVVNLNSQIQAAVDTIIEVMQDSNNNAAVRLQAAQTVLNNVGKFADRLQDSENAVLNQRQSNCWF